MSSDFQAGDVSAVLPLSHVGLITMHRPPANYFDAELLEGLHAAFDWVAAQDGRAAVLAAEGKHFCAGMNFGSGGRDPDALYSAAARLFELDIPIVAAVNGSAIGGGLGLALVADYRVAGQSARFWANFTQLGLHHGFGLTVTLPDIVGAHRAADLLVSGRRVDSSEALRIGLCDRVAADEQLDVAALELAAELAAVAPLAVRSIRRTLRRGLADRVRAATAYELAEQRRLMSTSDFREGVRASRDRRTPEFRGE